MLELLRLSRHRQFGSKSEKSDSGQMGLFNEADLPENIKAIEKAELDIQVTSPARKKKKVGRKPLPATLPRQQVIHDLEEAEKKCICGSALTCIGGEKSEQLEIIPAQIYVIEHIRKKYACKQCEQTLKQAALPAQPLPKSIAAPGLLSHVIISKFEDHLPLYRQERQLQRTGVDIPRATLSSWVIKCAYLLLPLIKLMQDYILTYDVAFADESTVQVLKEPGRKPQSKSYMWVFGGGQPDKFCILYKYDPSRSHKVPLAFLEDFQGYLHCDGYPGYDSLATKLAIKQVGCWYHARRKFVEADKVSPGQGLAAWAIEHIRKLSQVERYITENALAPPAAYEYRRQKALPFLEQFKAWLESSFVKVPPKSLIGGAISYTLNQWSKLMTYLEDGRLANNNNLMERCVKPFAIGRKNWLFCRSVKGADAAANLLSLIETCKVHNIVPYDWFYFVLKKIPTCSTMEELVGGV